MGKRENESHGTQRGRNAGRPSDIPKAGWKDILFRVKDEIAEDNLSMIAAGVAFYAFLAIFPALAAFVSIYGLVTEPADLQKHISSVQTVLPAQVAELVNNELQRIGESQKSSLSWSLGLGILLFVWSASKAMKAMLDSMNVVYGEKEKRGFFKLNIAAVSMTFAAIIFTVIGLGFIVVVPAVLGTFNLGEPFATLIDYVRWPILAAAGIFALSALYRFGPSREKPRWRWVSWGAVFATFIWLIGSFLFSFYVANFGSYNATYGSLGVVVILMMWLLLSVYSILLGAEINSETEHQTAQDTTEGEPQRLGRRGAYVADTVGRRA